MNLDDIVAVSGLPGLYRLAANRSNGLIVEDLDTGKRRFASARKHNFTPLGSIGVYLTDGDTKPLPEVFQRMLDQYDDNPPVDPGSSQDDLFDYFEDVLPNYDPERVYLRDVKKIVQWFGYLKEKGLLAGGDEEE
jgi:hypothetical protein